MTISFFHSLFLSAFRKTMDPFVLHIYVPSSAWYLYGCYNRAPADYIISKPQKNIKISKFLYPPLCPKFTVDLFFTYIILPQQTENRLRIHTTRLCVFFTEKKETKKKWNIWRSITMCERGQKIERKVQVTQNGIHFKIKALYCGFWSSLFMFNGTVESIYPGHK